jgi:hypothetical protein
MKLVCSSVRPIHLSVNRRIYHHICSSVAAIFLDSGTEEYITVIFLGTEECTLFSCSEYVIIQVVFEISLLLK